MATRTGKTSPVSNPAADARGRGAHRGKSGNQAAADQPVALRAARRGQGGGKGISGGSEALGGLSRAERNIVWIEKYCVVPEGQFHGRLIKLREWQKDNIRRLYDNPAGTRRAILSFGRKNGKTALAACLLLLHLCGPEARPNSQLFSTAQSRDQAAILYKLAAQIVRQSLNLYKVIVIRDARKELTLSRAGYGLSRALSGSHHRIRPVAGLCCA